MKALLRALAPSLAGELPKGEGDVKSAAHARPQFLAPLETAPPQAEEQARRDRPVTVAGYASLFGIADLAGDVVRAGAFRESIRRLQGVPMLVRHDPRLVAGRWIEVKEDTRGLYVRGEIDPERPGAALACRLIARGLDGLSIGFVTRAARKRANGRDLLELDLVEVSLVDRPMMPQARLLRDERTAGFQPASA